MLELTSINFATKELTAIATCDTCSEVHPVVADVSEGPYQIDYPGCQQHEGSFISEPAESCTSCGKDIFMEVAPGVFCCLNCGN